MIGAVIVAIPCIITSARNVENIKELPVIKITMNAKEEFMDGKKGIPDTIYLQVYGDSEEIGREEEINSGNVTWSEERIYPADVEYRRVTSSKTTECDKKQALTFYEHLLDLVEKERMSKNFSEWCELEREYIALIGKEHFTKYFTSN